MASGPSRLGLYIRWTEREITARCPVAGIPGTPQPCANSKATKMPASVIQSTCRASPPRWCSCSPDMIEEDRAAACWAMPVRA